MTEPTRLLAVSLMAAEDLASGDATTFLRVAVEAERLGVDAVLLPDHVAVSERAHREREGFPFPLEAAWLEPLTALAAVAAVTDRVRLGTNVLIAPLRPAVLLAKQIATLDVISGGRAEVAVGAGWQEAEFDAALMPFERRGAALEELVQVCRALWSGGPAAHHGARVDFDDLVSMPLPPQGADLPLQLGVALGPLNVRRIAELGLGWAPAPMPADELRAGIARLREAYGDAGRDPDTLQVRAATTLHPHGLDPRPDVAHPLAEAIELWEAGARTVIVHPTPYCRSLADLPAFLEPLLAARDAGAVPAR